MKLSENIHIRSPVLFILSQLSKITSFLVFSVKGFKFKWTKSFWEIKKRKTLTATIVMWLEVQLFLVILLQVDISDSPEVCGLESKANLSPKHIKEICRVPVSLLICANCTREKYRNIFQCELTELLRISTVFNNLNQ